MIVIVAGKTVKGPVTVDIKGAVPDGQGTGDGESPSDETV